MGGEGCAASGRASHGTTICSSELRSSGELAAGGEASGEASEAGVEARGEAGTEASGVEKGAEKVAGVGRREEGMGARNSDGAPPGRPTGVAAEARLPRRRGEEAPEREGLDGVEAEGRGEALAMGRSRRRLERSPRGDPLGVVADRVMGARVGPVIGLGVGREKRPSVR